MNLDFCVYFLLVVCLVVITHAVDCLEKLVSEKISCFVSSEHTHSFTDRLHTILTIEAIVSYKRNIFIFISAVVIGVVKKVTVVFQIYMNF